jgi:hypothetical protein
MNVGNDLVGVHGSSSQQFRRQANHRTGKTDSAAGGLDPAFQSRMVDVFAVSGEQEVHAMHGGQGHMDCVRRGHGGDDLIFEQECDQGIGGSDRSQPWQSLKHREAFGDHPER